MVVARFHEEITDRLLAGAREAAEACGIAPENIETFDVAGAFELPLVLQAIANTELYAAAVAIGAVIRGETSHFDYVAGESARGITDVMLKTGLPIGLGLLTTDNEKQARERAGGSHGNKGYEAVIAALEVAALLATIEKKH